MAEPTVEWIQEPAHLAERVVLLSIEQSRATQHGFTEQAKLLFEEQIAFLTRSIWGDLWPDETPAPQ